MNGGHRTGPGKPLYFQQMQAPETMTELRKIPLIYTLFDTIRRTKVRQVDPWLPAWNSAVQSARQPCLLDCGLQSVC